jgi:diguanylate cyclase (GGDEF)-like protein
MDRIEQAIGHADRHHRSFTLLFLDLDRFKLVNDSLGHAVGDELLRVITRRIGRLVNSGDTFARLSGDEFVLLLTSPMPADELSVLAGHLSQVVAAPVFVADGEVSVTCSLGYCVYPQDGVDAITLVRHGDAAMYVAKKDGGNRMRRYTADLSSRASERLEVETQLKQALQRGEFLLHYQPQIEIVSGRIVGVEALVRWQHPVRGLVPPTQFIPLAEESGLIEPIGEWVLRTACAQAAAWQRSGLPALRMGINVSARQFHNPLLESLVAQLLIEHDLAPDQLELEITESLSMKDPEESIRILASFQTLGIGIAIDDFGTGYSNLAYLRRFPVRRIKLDRSFVSELASQSSSRAIVEAMVAMAHKLGLQVIAEGVETTEQRNQLLSYGCDELQGYWFARPVDAAACGVLLQKQLESESGSSTDAPV